MLSDLRAPDAATRAAAARSLGGVRPARSEIVSALAGALGDPDPAVQMAAAAALGQTGGRAAMAALIRVVERGGTGSRAPAVRAAIEALGRFRPSQVRGALAGLSSALRHPDEDVRRQAAETLGTLNERRAVEALSATAVGDASESVRRAAVASLETLDPAAASDVAVAPVIEKGEQALRAGRLVDTSGQGALGFALQAEAAAPRSARAAQFHRKVTQAIQARVNELGAARDLAGATALLDQAMGADPSNAALKTIKTGLEAMARQEYDRTHRFRVGHLHGLAIKLASGKMGFGNNACVGTLELLEDGFSFRTEETPDKRREDVRIRVAEIKKVDPAKDGQRISIQTTQGKWSFAGDPSVLEAITRHLSRSGG